MARSTFIARCRNELTCGDRRVWKAPAGTEATLAGVDAPQYVTTDAENGVLNPLGLNCLRAFPMYGNVSWGSRTLEGADESASEWKYIPVHPSENSLYCGPSDANESCFTLWRAHNGLK